MSYNGALMQPSPTDKTLSATLGYDQPASGAPKSNASGIGDTVAMPPAGAASLALGATVASVGGNETQSLRSMSPKTTMSRSTVLPRVEVVGNKPKFVVEARQRYERVRALGEGGMGEVAL